VAATSIVEVHDREAEGGSGSREDGVEYVIDRGIRDEVAMMEG
jgi:hypothetical protein